MLSANKDDRTIWKLGLRLSEAVKTPAGRAFLARARSRMCSMWVGPGAHKPRPNRVGLNLGVRCAAFWTLPMVKIGQYVRGGVQFWFHDL